MIPFSILSGKLYNENILLCDFNVLELGADFFTFRVSKGHTERAVSADCIVMSFFLFSQQRYRRVKLTDCTIRVCDESQYFTVLRAETGNAGFMELSGILSSEYLHYVEAKLTLSDEELSHEFSKYPMNSDDIFAEGYEDAVSSMWEGLSGETLDNEWTHTNLTGLRLYYAIENPWDAKLVYDEGLEAYLRGKTVELCKLNHPLVNIPAEGVILGNPYCHNLLIAPNICKMVYIKLKNSGKKVYITIPPCPEFFLQRCIEYIDELTGIMSGLDGFIVNDMGIYEYIKDRYPEFYLEKGVLLNKAYRDPREKYLCAGTLPTLMRSDSFVYGPYYQVNTATFCTMKTLCDGKPRGKNSRVKGCHMPCQNNCVLYPKHLYTIGRYNSTFGFCREMFLKPETLKDCMNAGFERLVINL